VCIEGGLVEIQTPGQWNLIGRIMTALPPPVLSPSHILPPPSSLCVFMHRNKNSARLLNFYYFNFFYFFKKTFAKSGSVCQ
jgi:hypothetical protein